MKMTYAAMCAAVLVMGCAERDRPGPTAGVTATANNFRLAVDVVAPKSGDVAVAGRNVNVRIHATEESGQLGGISFVARRFDNLARIDSGSVSFNARFESTADFVLKLPESLPNNAQVDIYGIARGTQAQARSSAPHAVIIVSCTQTTLCQ